ncbi:hypothetical protein Q8A73_011976 [Channa argus]|nr:hypothetical protein Q8A73_011976 [Channa argus]
MLAVALAAEREWVGWLSGLEGVETSATLRITEDSKMQEDNKIFAWGNGTSGQLGDGERKVKKQPVEIRLPQEINVKGSDANMKVSNIVGVACGSRHSFIWTETGQAYSFGNNFYAQLGYDFQWADFKEHQWPLIAPGGGPNLAFFLEYHQPPSSFIPTASLCALFFSKSRQAAPPPAIPQMPYYAILAIVVKNLKLTSCEFAAKPSIWPQLSGDDSLAERELAGAAALLWRQMLRASPRLSGDHHCFL